jgi:hypothetical protein
LERIDNETVKLTIETVIPALGGTQIITGDAVSVSSEYELSGTATLPGTPMGSIPFNVTGTVHPTDKTLTMNCKNLERSCPILIEDLFRNFLRRDEKKPRKVQSMNRPRLEPSACRKKV